MIRDMKYVDENFKTLCISVKTDGNFKISEPVVIKALMISMNYIVENMKKEDEESVEKEDEESVE